MGIKISEMTPDASIGGGELIPVSDAGTAKSVSITGINSFVVDQIEAITAGTAVTGADGVFILQSGVLKPVDIDLVAQHAIDTVWGKADDASPAGTDKIAIKDTGTTENTVTLANLATYVQGAIRAAVLNPATLDAAGATAGADLLVIGQSGVAKKITLTALNTAIYAGLAAYVTATTAASAATDADVFYVVQGGVEKQVTLTQIKTQLGITNMVTIPGTSTENYIPQWAATSKVLKEGLAVVSTVAASGATTGAIPTDTAVRSAIEASNIGATTTDKETIVAADTMFIRDSEAADAYKSVLLSNLNKFVVDQIEAITAATTFTGSDSAFILQGGALKPVASTVVAQYAQDVVWGKANEATLESTDKVPLKSGTTELTMTLATLWAYLSALGAKTLGYMAVNDQVGTTYTVAAADAGKYVRCTNGSAITVTLDATVADLALGTVIEIEQGGAGQVTVAGDSVTVNADVGLDTAGQYGTIRLVKTDAAVWTAIGGVA
jgi:hypothetical protein